MFNRLRIQEWVNSISDNSLYNLLSVARALMGIVVFFTVVVLWDTLPSYPPTENATIYLTKSSDRGTNYLHVTEDYQIVKLVEFEVKRYLINTKSQEAIRLQSSNVLYKIGPKTETLVIPYPLDTGTWCLHSSVHWVNGLSLVKHVQHLPITCIEVN